MSLPTTSSAAAIAETSPKPAADDRPVVISARGVGKKYDLQRHRSILLKDAARIALGDAEKEVFWALRDVNFEIRKGETVGFVGPNGAGKSTILSLIARTTRPTVGTIEVNGRVSALLELGAGFHPDFTGRENIYINGSVMGISRKELDARIDEIIAFSELGPFIDEPVRNYSSGMLARLGFSVATAVDPDILIVDEALSVGDAAFQEKSLKRMLEFKERGCTIVFVSHSIEVVRSLCEQAILLANGQVLCQGPAEEVARDYEKRLAEHRVAGTRSPFEKERVPLWKRLLAAGAIAGLIGSVGYVGARFVLTSELPEQRPLTPREHLMKR